MLKFRNINATPSDPVSKWGSEGVLTALERGGLVHLQRLSAAALADPEGQVAHWVVDAARCTSRPAAQLIARRVEEARNPALEVSRRVREAIALSGMSARKFAAQCGTSQSRLSTYATGKVTPSADVFLRIERASGRLAGSPCVELNRWQASNATNSRS